MIKNFKNIFKFKIPNVIRKNWFSIIFLIVFTALVTLTVIPTEPKWLGEDLRIHLGLDLQGGVEITYKADLSKLPRSDRKNAISSLTEVIRRRVDALGVAEPVIQATRFTNGTEGVVVSLPGVSDVNQALEVVGKTAALDFREVLNPDQPDAGWTMTKLEGKHLKRAVVTFPEQSSEPQISIYFNGEGRKLFSEITERNVQKPLAIFLDGQLVSAPVVQEKISQGEAVISGDFTIETANQLAIQLNAGALPVPITVEDQRTVGATLGADSIQKSLFAGVIAVLAVVVFMIANYKLPGILAALVLSVYSLTVLAIFKFIPVTLTLAGIAGFILSIGIAVDANVLIFERLREELRQDRSLRVAIENAFSRAWVTIRDSNVSGLITTLILFWFGSGIIKGFALTLSIGILVSMFTAIFVTKQLFRIVTDVDYIRSKSRWFY